MYDNPLLLQQVDIEKTAVELGVFTSFYRKSRSRSAKFRGRRKRNESSLVSVTALERSQRVEVIVVQRDHSIQKESEKSVSQSQERAEEKLGITSLSFLPPRRQSKKRSTDSSPATSSTSSSSNSPSQESDV